METKKVILILLTVFIVGPLVFVGTCLPIGFLSFNNYSSGGGVIIGAILGLILAIWAVIAISKRIARK
jgi:hypothetical protein